MTESADPQITASVFLRKGGEGLKTKLFENLSTAGKDTVLARASLGLDEVPVIAYFDSATDWFLITTQRLICSKLGELQSTSILRLDHVDDNFDAAYRRWEVADDRESRNPKMEIDEIRLVTIDGERWPIWLEPGKSFCGVLNTLMWLCRWAKLQRKGSGSPTR